jgi:hypothetical protein
MAGSIDSNGAPDRCDVLARGAMTGWDAFSGWGGDMRAAGFVFFPEY